MNYAKIIKRIIELKTELAMIASHNSDTEQGHIRGDEILCEILELLGHEEVVELYNKIDKWYA